MIAANLLDILLVLALLVVIGEGVRDGLARSLGGILGLIAGGIAAFLLIPVLTALLPDRLLRIALVVAISVLLLVAGHALGRRIGRAIDGDDEEGPGAASRLVGGLLNGVVGALTLALVAGGVASMGVPIVSQAVSRSLVLEAIDTVTPPPLDGLLARVRAAILEEGLPTINEALGGVVDSPGIPDLPPPTDALGLAAQSVVRIGGTAYACGQNQTGTGFVVADDRVVTNAHVVAGVDQPIVEAPDGQTLEGRVVYLDPVDDLAVLAVDGLDAAALALSDPLSVGDAAVVDGYPYGGPFTSGAAEVLAVSTERIADIYGNPGSPREVYTIAAVVQPGNSGGPLLTPDGEVAGVVFARNTQDAELGYAMTNTELAPVVQAAAGLDDAVSSGACVRG